jgi:hypothetical protein
MIRATCYLSLRICSSVRTKGQTSPGSERERTHWALFAGLWRRLGFSGKILVSESLVRDQGLADAPDAARVDLETLLVVADAFVIDFDRLPGAQRPDDFGGLPIAVARALNQSLLHIAQAEYGRIDQGASPRQIIAITAINEVASMGSTPSRRSGA